VNCIYATVAEFRTRHIDDWVFVRHEDLASAPLEGFEKLFGELGLSFDKETASFIEDKCQGRRPGAVNRVASETTQSWRLRLSDDEVSRIQRETEKVASLFYDPTRLAARRG
jgi:hypothetical protein